MDSSEQGVVHSILVAAQRVDTYGHRGHVFDPGATNVRVRQKPSDIAGAMRNLEMAVEDFYERHHKDDTGEQAEL